VPSRSREKRNQKETYRKTAKEEGGGIVVPEGLIKILCLSAGWKVNQSTGKSESFSDGNKKKRFGVRGAERKRWEKTVRQ